MPEYIWAIIGLAGGAAIGWFAERMRRGGAYQNRDEILRQAQTDADNVRKSAELTAKEELLQRREKLENELSGQRDELREQERRLDKRETVLDEQQEDFRKRERMLEMTQNKLADRNKAVESKEAELERMIKEEQEKLYNISGSQQGRGDRKASRPARTRSEKRNRRAYFKARGRT